MHATFPAWLHAISIVTLVAGAVCAAIIIVDEVSRPQKMWIMNLVWPLTALFGSTDHKSAEELADEIRAQAPDVHLSTIYRNLEELERLGVIDSTRLGSGPATYHLASAAHGHLVCEKCGSMTEVPDEMFAGLIEAARDHYGFTINPHRFAVTGRCANCA